MAGWLDASFNHDGSEPSPSAWAEHWSRCIEEAAAADVTLLYACAEERQMGALMEVGSRDLAAPERPLKDDCHAQVMRRIS
jgi:hypothetical protein